MATDIRLNDVADFTRAHLEAEAALTIAALGEPDDDKYLEAEKRAKGYYAPDARPLGPFETRWARPGGTTPTANVDVTDSVRPGVLYAVGEIDDDNWVALVGARRDPAGVSLAEALLIRRTPAGLRIVGRAAVDPFKENLTFEPAGGEPVDPGLVRRGMVLAEPSYPGHTEFVRSWKGAASRGYGPGITWLAARTGKDPDELVRSPQTALAALNDAIREAADLAARAESKDPGVQAAAREEIAALQQELTAGPTPGDVALGRIAAGLRDLTERLRGGGTGGHEP